MTLPKHDHNPADPHPQETCLEVFEKLSEYLDGELSPEDCAEIQEHIKDCAPCVAFVESLKTSIQVSHELSPQKPEHELPPQVQEKLKAAWRAALQRRIA